MKIQEPMSSGVWNGQHDFLHGRRQDVRTALQEIKSEVPTPKGLALRVAHHG